MKKAMSSRMGGSAILIAAGLLMGPPIDARGALPQAGAQVGDTIDLTLDQALAIAEGNNPSYRRALNTLDVGGAESRAVWMGTVLPRVDVNLLNTGYFGNRVLQAEDFFGNPVENDESGWRFSSSTSQSIGLSWTIQGTNLVNAVKRFEIDERGREIGVESAGLEVERNVRRNYFAVVLQRELLDLEVASLDERVRDREVVEQRFRFAQATRVEVLRAELTVEEQRRTIRQHRRALDQARLELRTTLGDPELRPFTAVAEPLPLFDPSELDDDSLVARSLVAHPLVRQEEGSLEGARLAVSEAKVSRWPTLNLGYTLGRQAQASEGAGLFDVTHDRRDLSNRFNVFLSFPYLSNYFGNRNAEVQAEVALRNQQETIRETRLQVEQDVRTQLIALRNAYETLVANRRTLEIAEEALRLARAEYRLGTLTFEELQDLIGAERDARRAAVTQAYAFHDALLNLETAVGGPVRPEGRTDGTPDPALPGGPLDQPR